jgi:hypothetical protein
VTELDDQVVNLLADLEEDIEQRTHDAWLRRLLAMLDRPALGYFRKRAAK